MPSLTNKPVYSRVQGAWGAQGWHSDGGATSTTRPCEGGSGDGASFSQTWGVGGGTWAGSPALLLLA